MGSARSEPRHEEQAEDAAPQQRSAGLRSRIGLYAVLVPYLLLLILWVYVFWAEGAFNGGPSGKAFGADYAMFAAAAQVMHHGGNPYDHNLLFRTEKAEMRRQHLTMTDKRSVVRVGNPPIFFWALEPTTGISFQPVALAWIVAMYVVSLIGALLTLSYLRWRRRYLPALFFVLMPPVLVGAFYGNVIGLVFVAIALSLLLGERRPFIAGVLLSLAWLKPPVALPIALLVVLFGTSTPLRITAGFGAASIVSVVFTVLTTGVHSLTQWVVGLVGYSRDMAIQPDVASLAGLYVGWAPHALRLALSVLTVAIALALTAYAWRRLPRTRPLPLAAVGWLWFAWLLATPYAHFFDLMLLTPAVLAMLGPNGADTATRYPAITLYLLLISLLLINPTDFHVYLLPIPTLIAGVLCYLQSRRLTGGSDWRLSATPAA